MKMDASASPEVHADFNVCSFFLQIQNSSFPTNFKPNNNTVIKYTKLPDFDFDSKVLWPRKNSYVLQPRLRRIIAMNDQDNSMKSSRSLRSEIGTPVKLMSSTYTKRKIVTISEDDEGDMHSNYSKGDLRMRKLDLKTQSAKSHRAAGSEIKETSTQRHTSRPAVPSRYLKKAETKPSAKSVALSSSKPLNTVKSSYKPKTIHQDANANQVQENRNRLIKEKENIKRNKPTNLSNSNKSLSKNLLQPSESEKEIYLIKNKLTENVKTDTQSKPHINQSKSCLPNNRKINVLKDVKAKYKPPAVIRVPLDNDRKHIETELTQISLQHVADRISKIDCATEVEKKYTAKDKNVGTDPEPEKIDVITEMEIETIQKSDSDVQTTYQQDSHFDNLHIPNLTLSKDNSDIPKEKEMSRFSKSLPNLQVPTSKITPRKEERDSSSVNHCKSASYIIGRATVTYTTRQKIDIHVVENNNDTLSNKSSSPLAYPLSVVSVLKKKINKKDLCESEARSNTQNKKDISSSHFVSCLNEIKSLNCSYVFDGNKLVKPSEIISTIRVNNGLLHNDYICEQFQRELDFIDSFFESLQYLESCSLSDKCFKDKKVERWVSKSGFDIKNPEYDSFFAKLENGTNIDDTETMASKSLCLLNILIRDEQKRAKNLLFVLKMREDALKDFTKSQILWLENKKKQDNIDITRLKKKQRGALLKLQHECGEMQRMRKALLTLSEKRKVALMKAKKNIELKLKNNVTVDHILLGKKKVKRSAGDRATAPLKCFDLSSSGCEESTTSRAKSDSAFVVPELLSIDAIKSAEKSIQTGDSLLEPHLVDQATDTAAENYISVDGGYLNILFNNLSLPEIFSNGKNYEVNEIALKSIVLSANTFHSGTDIIEKFMDQIKKCEPELSTTPSTARSLVEELDQYYKGLSAEEKSPPPSLSPEREYQGPKVFEQPKLLECERSSVISASTFTSDTIVTLMPKKTEETLDNLYVNESGMNSVNTQVFKGKDSITIATQAGPLPVPAGAVAARDSSTPDSALDPAINIPSSVSSDQSSSSVCAGSSLGLLAIPAQSEAEELRRQQLAIEREIKALEQQQCQLLVVREIPDKPPPPYTPPADARVPKIPRMFLVDETLEEKVHRNLTDSITVSIEPTDAFDIFLQDFCQESLEKHKKEQSDKPWDACNLLPQKAPSDTNKVVHRTAGELKDTLSGITPTNLSGVGARRSDHIDDILFAEWRRCEPEWTALHNDEAQVKSQIFEGIFQKILTETIDEYKKTVLIPNQED